MLFLVITSVVFFELLTRAYIDVCLAYKYVCIMDYLHKCI